MKTACLAGLCSCAARDTQAAQGNTGGEAQTRAPKPATMPQKWIATLLPLLAKGDREHAKRILKAASESHYEDLKMQATVERFRGSPDDFLAFLRKEWGWVIEYDRDGGVIRVNENKSSCVCPLVQTNQGAGLEVLCYCSEGFAEKMFSEVFGFRVRAEVTESILRGYKSCKYKIDLGRPGT
jgi:hypothetical protein